MNEVKDFSFEIKEQEKSEDGVLYDVTVRVPMSLGYIDNMNIVFDGNYYKLDYVENKDGYSIFDGTVSLCTKAIYHYWFSFNVNGNHVFYGDKNYNLSTNFSVPDWAKGKMMYHIFVDRFNKRDNSLLKEEERLKKKWP